jgi:hypothetical protein
MLNTRVSINSSEKDDEEEAKEEIGELVRIPTKTSISVIENRSPLSMREDGKDEDEDEDYGNGQDFNDGVDADDLEKYSKRRLKQMMKGFQLEDEEDDDHLLREAYDVYISYYSKSSNPVREKFVEKLKSRLELNGLKIFFEPPKSTLASPVAFEEISFQALQSSRIILFMITEDSWNLLQNRKDMKSKPCRDFYSSLFLQSSEMIIPILLDPIPELSSSSFTTGNSSSSSSSDGSFCLSALFSGSLDLTKVASRPEYEDEFDKKFEEVNHRINMLTHARSYFIYPCHYMILNEFQQMMDFVGTKLNEFQTNYREMLNSFLTTGDIHRAQESIIYFLNAFLPIFQIPRDAFSFHDWIYWSKNFLPTISGVFSPLSPEGTVHSNTSGGSNSNTLTKGFDHLLLSSFVKICMKHSHFIYYLILLHLQEMILLTQCKEQELNKRLYNERNEESSSYSSNEVATQEKTEDNENQWSSTFSSCFSLIYSYFPEFYSLYPAEQTKQDILYYLYSKSLYLPFTFRWLSLYSAQKELQSSVVFIATHEAIQTSFEKHYSTTTYLASLSSSAVNFPANNFSGKTTNTVNDSETKNEKNINNNDNNIAVTTTLKSPFQQIQQFAKVLNYFCTKKLKVFQTTLRTFPLESHLGDIILETLLSLLKSWNRHLNNSWKLYLNYFNIYIYLEIYEHYFLIQLEKTKQFLFEWEKYEMALNQQPTTSNNSTSGGSASAFSPYPNYSLPQSSSSSSQYFESPMRTSSSGGLSSSFSLRLSFQNLSRHNSNYNDASQYHQLTIIKVSQYINKIKHKNKLVIILVSQMKSILIDSFSAFYVSIEKRKFSFDYRMNQILMNASTDAERNELIPFLSEQISEIRREYRKLVQLIDRKKSRITIKLLRRQLSLAEDEIKLIINDWNDLQENITAIVAVKHFFLNKKLYPRCVKLTNYLLQFLSLKNPAGGFLNSNGAGNQSVDRFHSRRSSERSLKYHRFSDPAISVSFSAPRENQTALPMALSPNSSMKYKNNNDKKYDFTDIIPSEQQQQGDEPRLQSQSEKRLSSAQTTEDHRYADDHHDMIKFPSSKVAPPPINLPTYEEEIFTPKKPATGSSKRRRYTTSFAPTSSSGGGGSSSEKMGLRSNTKKKPFLTASSPLLSKINSLLPMTSYKYTSILWNHEKYFIYALQKIPLTNLFIYECARRYFSILYNAYEIQYSFYSKPIKLEIYQKCYQNVKELNVYIKQLKKRRIVNIDWNFEVEILQALGHLLLKFVERFRDMC